MASLERLWLAMARMHDLVDTRAGWELVLGGDLVLVERFLRPVRGTARVWPCGLPSDGCARQVVRHADGAVVAVCSQEPPDCDRIELESTDLALLRLDLEAIADELRAGLPLERAVLPAVPGAVVIGELRASGPLRLALTRHDEVLGLLEVADALCPVDPRGSLVLLAPVDVPPAGERFERLRSTVLPLCRYGIRASPERWNLELGALMIERRAQLQGLDPTPFLGDAYELVLDPATLRYWARGRLLDLKKRALPRRLLEALARWPRVLVVRKDLGGAVWPDAAPGEIEAYETNLRTHKMNLDRVLADAGATGWIVAVEGSDVDGGYLLDLDPARVLWWSESAGLVGAQ